MSATAQSLICPNCGSALWNVGVERDGKIVCGLCGTTPDRIQPGLHGTCAGCGKPVMWDQSHTTAASGDPKRPEHWHTRCWNDRHEDYESVEPPEGRPPGTGIINRPALEVGTVAKWTDRIGGSRW